MFSSSLLHDSLLKENRHLMQPSQALINKSPWVAVYPAFFVNPINVYQTRGVSHSSCPLWSSTMGTSSCAAVNGLSLGDVWPGFHSPVWTSGRDKSHPQHPRMLLRLLRVHGNSHAEKHGPCDGLNNQRQPEAFLMASKHALTCTLFLHMREAYMLVCINRDVLYILP